MINAAKRDVITSKRGEILMSGILKTKVDFNKYPLKWDGRTKYSSIHIERNLRFGAVSGYSKLSGLTVLI